jgi:hypothetical protein
MSLHKKFKDEIFQYLISFLPPQHSDKSNNDIGICTLIPHRYVDMFIYTVHSFFYYSGKKFPIYVIDNIDDEDRLQESDYIKLEKHFSIIYERNAKNKISSVIKNFPYFYKYRFENKNAASKLKFDALLLSPFNRSIYLDSDILFFNKPTELIKCMANSSKEMLYFSRVENAHVLFPALLESELYIRMLFAMYLKKDIKSFDPFFTSGCLYIPNKYILSLERFNEVFKHFYSFDCAHEWLSEERATSLVITAKNSKKLTPKKYYTATFWEQYLAIDFKKVIAVHYQGTTGLKSQFISDAVLQMLRTNFFHKSI